MVAEIVGNQQPLHKVFGEDYVFEIPLYQRPYSWTTEEAGDLLEDLLSFMGDPASKQAVSEIPPYFLGSIVLTKATGRPEAKVVDGQQRLTTLTMLIAGLRETTSGEKGGLTKRLYEEADGYTGTKAQYRLTLRGRDAEFFREYVQEPGGIARLNGVDPAHVDEPKRRIRENALYLAKRLETLSEPTRQHLAKFMLQRCYVIVVSTPDANAAYRVFAVLNDRGLDLSFTDILKAEIIGALPGLELQETYGKRWETVEEALGRGGLETLFAHVRMIHMRAKPRGTILEEFRESVKPGSDPARFVDETFVPFADALRIVRDATYESTSGADAVNLWLRRLNRVDNFDWMPPAMLFLRRHPAKPEALAAFFRDLERQAAIMMITRRNVNERIDRYGLILEEVEAGRDPFREGSPVLKNDAEDRKVVRKRLDGDIYDETKTRMFTLTRLDEELSDEGATYDHEIITVEHVLPQTPKPGSQWLQWFPEEKQRLAWEGRLANLVLLSRRKNAEAQNYEFDVKKEKYFKSKKGKTAAFALTVEVLNESVWTPAVLEKRQERLLGVLHKAWRL